MACGARSYALRPLTERPARLPPTIAPAPPDYRPAPTIAAGGAVWRLAGGM